MASPRANERRLPVIDSTASRSSASLAKGDSARSTAVSKSFSYKSLLREIKNGEDVYEKYEVLSVIGAGSMGAVAKVRIKPAKVGGSAFVKKKRAGIFGFGLLGRKTKSVPIASRQKAHDRISQSQTHLNASGSSLQESAAAEPPDADCQSQHVYALKSILLDRVSDLFIDELRNEVSILKNMDHPNIVKAYELYFVHRQIYLVLELCDGGDLFAQQPYSERRAADLTSQIVSAVRYMHDHGIVHRDLKFEVSDCSLRCCMLLYCRTIPHVDCSTHRISCSYPIPPSPL
jgi:serine/threonine protein kinase